VEAGSNECDRLLRIRSSVLGSGPLYRDSIGKTKGKKKREGTVRARKTETVDYTAKSTVLAVPRSAATSLPRTSRVNVYIASAGTVSVEMTVVGRSPVVAVERC